jgi:hypothetical protein
MRKWGMMGSEDMKTGEWVVFEEKTQLWMVLETDEEKARAYLCNHHPQGLWKKNRSGLMRI